MSKVFFTGCTHFGHENIIKMADRPFESVDEMNEKLIENWNKTVKPNDEIYHLGDISYWRGDSIASYWLEKLNGRKHIIIGNHDNIGDLSMVNPGCKIYSLHQYLYKKIGGHMFAFFHFPMEDWDGRYSGSIHLHCHTHQKELERPLVPYVHASGLTMEADQNLTLPRRYPEGLYCNRFNVTVEATNYTPISLDEIVERSRYKNR